MNYRLRTRLRDGLALLFRRVPGFRGKARIGKILTGLTTREASDEECLVTTTIGDGLEVVVDLRSTTEAHVYWTGQYETAVVERLCGLLQRHDRVVDEGANIVFYTLPMSSRLRDLDGGQVYAFEPMPANLARLESNCALNGLGSFVSAHGTALGDTQGEVDITLTELSSTASIRSPVTTLDHFAATNSLMDPTKTRCRLIKADIEGAEAMLVRGARAFLEVHRPWVYAEFNRLFMGRLGDSFLDVWDIMAPLGYRLFRERQSSHSHAHTGIFEPAEPVKGLEHVLFVPPGAAPRLMLDVGCTSVS